MRIRIVKNLNCACCGYEPDDEYDGIIGAICPECNWEVDHLDAEDNYYSGANKDFLDAWTEKYLNSKKNKEKSASQVPVRQD